MRNVKGQWKAIQGNGPKVTFAIDNQDGATGTVAGHAITSDNWSGGVSGRVSNTGIVLVADWRESGHDSRGEYNGTFGPEGRLHGITFDLRNPSSMAGWFSDKEFGEV
jgi:hypothetical protein